MCRRAVIGAVALSLAVSAGISLTANARPRFGPAGVLRMVMAPLGAVVGGGRHYGFARHRRHAPVREARHAPVHEARVAEVPRDTEIPPDTDAPSVVLEPVAAAQRVASAPAVFWPSAADDLLDYAFFPRGGDDRFWAYGYGAILQNAFAAEDRSDARAARAARADVGEVGCSQGAGAALDADGLIERITQAIEPTPRQRAVLEELRTASVEVIERIASSCPKTIPATPSDKLKAIQDRIWAMHDALLTLRGPFETFYRSLTDEQHWRLQRAEPDPTTTAAVGSFGGLPDGAGAVANARAAARAARDAPVRGEICEQAASLAAWPLRAIERAVQPNEQQRAMLEGLRLRLMGMGQLIAASCPTYPLLGPMDRIAAVGDRLDVMLFAVMTLSPALPDFYESLSDRQKSALGRVIRQFRRSSQFADSL
jgi:hypothetical protein